MANHHTVILDTTNPRAHRPPQIIAVFALALAGVTTSPAADEILPRALVVEKNSPSLSVISFQDATVRKSAEFARNPQEVLVSPDATKILVITDPENKSPRENRNKDTRYTFHFLDARSLAVTGSTTIEGDLGTSVTKSYLNRSRAEGWWNSAGTRFTVFVGSGARCRLDSQLVQIDTTTGAIVGRQILAKNAEAQISGLTIVRGKSLALAWQPLKFKNLKGFFPDLTQPARDIILVNLDDLAATKRIAIPGEFANMWLGPDARHLHIDSFTAGKDRKSTHFLSTISCERGAEIWKDQGSAGYAVASSFAPDETLIGIRGPAGESAFLILRGDQVIHRMKLPDVPGSIQMSSKTKRAYITCAESLQVVDLVEFKIVGSVPTPHLHPSFWSRTSGDSRALALTLSALEDRGYLTYEGDDEVSAVDLRKFTVIKTFRLESSAAKVGKLALAALVQGVMSGLAPGMMMGPALPPTYTPRAAALDNDERLLYLVSPEGVSVVDTDQLKKTKVLTIRDGIKTAMTAFMLTNDLESAHRLVVGGYLIDGMGGGLDTKRLVVNTFDTASGERVTGETAPRYGFAYVGDGRYSVDYDGKAVRLRISKNLEVLKSVEVANSIGEVVGLAN